MAVYAMVQNNTNKGGKFTLEQIKAAHAKVKSGADFPSYVQELIQLGIKSYETFVKDGHTDYFGANNYHIIADAKWVPLEIEHKSDKENFIRLLKEHQQGQSDYFTFISDCATNGIEKWIVDTEKMTCAYYDLQGNELLIEVIPSPK